MDQLSSERATDAFKTIKSAISMNPTVAIVKFWQGRLEFSLRILVLVLAFADLVCAGVGFTRVQDRLDGFNCEVTNCTQLLATLNLSRAVLIWVALLILKEALVLTGRFLNFDFINTFAIVIFILDIINTLILSLIGAIIGIIGAVALSILNNTLIPFVVDNEPALIALVFFTLLIGVVLVVEAIYMCVFLCFKWNDNITKYANKSGE